MKMRDPRQMQAMSRMRDDQIPEEFMQGFKVLAQDMPSPTKPALVFAALGAGLGLIFGKSPIRWGLVSGGTAWVATIAMEGSFAAGSVMGMMALRDNMEAEGKWPYGTPPTPVVTRGAFAGYPRPLYNTEDAHVRGYTGE